MNGKVEVTTDGKVTLTDKIAFEDLTPNVEYDQKVTWMDTRTKLPVMIDGKELTSTIKFTPKEETGTVTVTIEDVVVQQLFGKDSKIQLVAFEETTYNDEPVATEKDFNNKGQTITINNPVEPAKPTSPAGTLPQTSGSFFRGGYREKAMEEPTISMDRFRDCHFLCQLLRVLLTVAGQ